MWFFSKKKHNERKVFGFLCDPKLAFGVKMIATQLETPIYPLVEHLLQLGVEQVYPALEDEDFKEELQEHLLNEHLLVPALDQQNDYDKAAAARMEKEKDKRMEAASFLVRILEGRGVPPEKVKATLKKLVAEARRLREDSSGL